MVECTKQNLKSEFEHELRHQTLMQTETIDLLRQQIDQLDAQLQQQQAAPQHICSVLPHASPFQDTNLPPQLPLHHFSWNVSMTNNSLVEVMDVLNRSMTNQYTVLQETLRQSQSEVQWQWQGSQRI